MAKKYYVVWQGRETGIFTDWDTCKKNVYQFAGAKYKSFKTRAEADAAFRGGSQAAIKVAKTTAKKPSGAAKKGLKTYTAEEVAELSVQIKIFTDGGCEPNPGKAASGVAVYREGQADELWYGLFNPDGTNNTAELNALHQALLMAEKEINPGEIKT